MFKKLLTDAIIKVLRHIGRTKTKYPDKLFNKTRASLIDKMKQINDKTSDEK